MKLENIDNRLTPNLLSKPVTMDYLVEKTGYNKGKIRKWLKSFGDGLCIGYKRPRIYWLKEEEEKARVEEFRNDMKTVSARNQFCYDSKFGEKK